MQAPNHNDAPFPPHGWVTGPEAARRLGFSLNRLKDKRFRWRLTGGRSVRRPEGGRCKLYPEAEVGRVEAALAAEAAQKAEAARAAEAARPPLTPPDGFVDREGARAIFGVTRRQWKRWVNNGTVNCAVMVRHRLGGRRQIFPVEALHRLREELFARDVLYNNAAGNFVVPAGWVRRHEARQMLGFTKADWDAWAAAGLTPTGERFDGGPTLYRVEDLKGMLARVGRLAPPYPDPDRPGAYRVPLCGPGEAGTREAVVDADTLALLDGAALAWGSGDRGLMRFVVLVRPDTPRGVAMRRVLMDVTNDRVQVGHVNGDPLDCRRTNLLVRTIQQRTRGARKMKAHKGRPLTSRFKGVCFENYTGKWRACIVVDGKTLRLGRFRDEIAAAQAYDEAARELFGQYAWLNFPDGVDARLEADRPTHPTDDAAQARAA